MEVKSEHIHAAKVLWDYHHVGHTLFKADIIFVLCSNDLRVADRAAALHHEGLAPLIVFSGGFGNFTAGIFPEPEADLFAKRAAENGVPIEKILIENKSTNTGENVLFTRKLLQNAGISIQKAIAVQKPFMERRTLGTISHFWPELDFCVTSPQIGFEEYCREGLPMSDIIHIMAGDFQRILLYPSKGFMAPQEVTREAMDAFQYLTREGYTGHLIEKRTP